MLSCRKLQRKFRRARHHMRMRCCRAKEHTKRTVYVKGFLGRNDPNTVVEPENIATVPLKRTTIHSSNFVSIACVDMGEVVMGLGFIFEVLRYPPSELTPTWTLSYSVWNDHAANRLLWRKCFSDVAAFFYVIDATEVQWINLAKVELDTFFSMMRPVPFPNYFLIIFLNRATSRGAMRVDEVDDYLNITSLKCRGYLIQPVHNKSRESLRSAASWLLEKLSRSANQTIDIYPDQILRQQRISVGLPIGRISTFALESSNTYHPEYSRKKSTDSDEADVVPLPGDAIVALNKKFPLASTPKQRDPTHVPPNQDDLARYRTFNPPHS